MMAQSGQQKNTGHGTNMKRYNQGFGKFGPMEQSNDGKWVTYEDYESIERRLKQEVNIQFKELWTEIMKYEEDNIYWKVCTFLEGIIIILGILLCA